MAVANRRRGCVAKEDPREDERAVSQRGKPFRALGEENIFKNILHPGPNAISTKVPFCLKIWVGGLCLDPNNQPRRTLNTRNCIRFKFSRTKKPPEPVVTVTLAKAVFRSIDMFTAIHSLAPSRSGGSGGVGEFSGGGFRLRKGTSRNERQVNCKTLIRSSQSARSTSLVVSAIATVSTGARPKAGTF